MEEGRRKNAPSYSSFNRRERVGQHLIWREVVRHDVQVAVCAGVAQPNALLLVQVQWEAGIVAAATDGVERSVEVHQQVGPGDALPHGRYVRVFLEDAAGMIAPAAQGRGQRGLSGCTHAHDGDERTDGRNFGF